MVARTASEPTSTVVRGNRFTRADITGEIVTNATMRIVRAVPMTIPASFPATSTASRPRATVSSPVPTRASTCAANNRA